MSAAADTSAEPPLVRFEDIDKTYDGEHLVVRSLNLDISRGEFLTLLGPSGSGKTTSLMMLAGFETPTDGEIYLNGKPIRNMPPHRRNIGMVFQNYALFPHMTVAENLAFPLQVRRIGRAETAERVARAMAMVKLEALAQRHPGQLSGGQQQRVALARALVFNPQLVLMDEPLGALDKRLREHMQMEIKRLHQDTGITVVYVTHDQSEALTMSDRIAVFNDGVIQQIAAPDTLYERPVNSFVANFIGENNTLSGQVEHREGRHGTVRLAGGELVEALLISPRANGATALSIRPERVRLLAPDADPGTDNRLSGRLRDIVYLGDHALALLDLPGTTDFMVRLQAGEQAGLTRGQDVTIAFAAEHCRALDPV
ncbi:Spermidine/putrescine import ATP-binding protein PotA [Rhodovastum atsumiense]|uniref:Spermidine/putrescine import ATP-binding protein PotA n=1 Tax=Rhodovastum atsumiense TaxID=504468 RepID=A0A5M6J1W1_9PROT|nr:ABC transporter ATP-binding protein [Rhodovastum atsumiense]KAA5614590.1 ABC transporter ATP-binding protein [Rhodovastum atsumiense]CAH2599914.1 Spermidine/putrescine import ATP-binding protein PotA [Rhodovastum atsumiense]